MKDKIKSFFNSLRESKILPGHNLQEILFFFFVDNLIKIKNILPSQVFILNFFVDNKYIKRSFFLDEVRFKNMILYDYIIYTFADKGFARGTSFSQVESLGKCLGEIVERIPFRREPEDRNSIISSIRSMRKNKIEFFDFKFLPQATKKQKETDQRLSYDDDSIFEWMQVTSFKKKNKIYVPNQLVYWDSFSKTPEKIIKEQNTNGLASADTEHSAIISALYECLQRHVFFEAWYQINQNLVVEVDLDSLFSEHSDIKYIKDEIIHNMLDFRVFRIESKLSDFFDVYFCVLENKFTKGVYVGCSGGNDSYTSIYRSIQEALSIYTFTNRILFNGEAKDNYDEVITKDFEYGIFGNHRVIWWGHYFDNEAMVILNRFLGTKKEKYIHKKNKDKVIIDKVLQVFGDFLYITSHNEINKKMNHHSCRVILPDSYTLSLSENLSTPIIKNSYPQNLKAHPFP